MMKRYFSRYAYASWTPALGGMAIGLIGVFACARGASAEDATSLTKPSGAAETYNVQVLHAAKVGDRIHMRREIEQSATEATEANGKPQSEKSGSTQIHFTGTLEVLAVGKHGDPTKWKVASGVASVRKDGGSKESILKPGTEFTVDFAGGKATVSEAGANHPLSEDAKKYLPIVFEGIGGKGDASLDEIIDNSTASRTGNWSVNTKAAAAALHKFDPKLKPSEVSGNAHIQSVLGEGEKKVLSVAYEFKATSKKPAGIPPARRP